MTGRQVIRAMCLLVLAILVPGAAMSPPSVPSFIESFQGRFSCVIGQGEPLWSSAEGNGEVVEPRHPRSIFGTWYWAYGAAPVHAAEPVRLRVSLAQPGPVLVSERVTITVELLTLTTFASAPVFDLPTIPGALLMKLEDRPVLGTAQVDGESYTVQQHELALFVMRPGAVQVPPFTVRFESPRHFGETPVEHRLTMPPLQVEARMPPGAENLPGLIATRELRVNQAWQPEPTSGLT